MGEVEGRPRGGGAGVNVNVTVPFAPRGEGIMSGWGRKAWVFSVIWLLDGTQMKQVFGLRSGGESRQDVGSILLGGVGGVQVSKGGVHVSPPIIYCPYCASTTLCHFYLSSLLLTINFFYCMYIIYYLCK